MVMPFQTFINSAVPVVVGWGESLPGTAQRSEFIDVWLTRPPLWHNWRSNFPSHFGVGKLGCAPGSPRSSPGTWVVVKQFLHWECQALAVKIPGGYSRKVGFYSWRNVGKNVSPVRAESRGCFSLCWWARLEVSLLSLCFTSLTCQRCCNILQATCSMYSRYFYSLLSNILWWVFYYNGCSVKELYTSVNKLLCWYLKRKKKWSCWFYGRKALNQWLPLTLAGESRCRWWM